MSVHTELMADRAGRFSAEECATLREHGFRAAAGYLGGYTPSPWKREGFTVAAEHLGGVLPIWVMHPDTQDTKAGHREGALAVRAMAALWPTHSHRPLVLDVEAGYFHGLTTARAIEAWRTVVAEYGFEPVLYSSASAIEAVTHHSEPACHPYAGWAGVWVAHWVAARIDHFLHLDHMDTRWRAYANRRAWQYAADVDCGGVVVDVSLCQLPLCPKPNAK